MVAGAKSAAPVRGPPARGRQLATGIKPTVRGAAPAPPRHHGQTQAQAQAQGKAQDKPRQVQLQLQPQADGGLLPVRAKREGAPVVLGHAPPPTVGAGAPPPLWEDACAPRTLAEWRGTPDARKRLDAFLAKVLGGRTAKAAAILVGPSGVGKSSLVRLLAAQHGLDVWDAATADLSAVKKGEGEADGQGSAGGGGGAAAALRARLRTLLLEREVGGGAKGAPRRLVLVDPLEAMDGQLGVIEAVVAEVAAARAAAAVRAGQAQSDEDDATSRARIDAGRRGGKAKGGGAAAAKPQAGVSAAIANPHPIVLIADSDGEPRAQRAMINNLLASRAAVLIRIGPIDDASMQRLIQDVLGRHGKALPLQRIVDAKLAARGNGRAAVNMLEFAMVEGGSAPGAGGSGVAGAIARGTADVTFGLFDAARKVMRPTAPLTLADDASRMSITASSGQSGGLSGGSAAAASSGPAARGASASGPRPESLWRIANQGGDRLGGMVYQNYPAEVGRRFPPQQRLPSDLPPDKRAELQAKAAQREVDALAALARVADKLSVADVFDRASHAWGQADAGTCATMGDYATAFALGPTALTLPPPTTGVTAGSWAPLEFPHGLDGLRGRTAKRRRQWDLAARELQLLDMAAEPLPEAAPERKRAQERRDWVAAAVRALGESAEAKARGHDTAPLPPAVGLAHLRPRFGDEADVALLHTLWRARLDEYQDAVGAKAKRLAKPPAADAAEVRALLSTKTDNLWRSGAAGGGGAN
jgi:hypothetical protein